MKEAPAIDNNPLAQVYHYLALFDRRTELEKTLQEHWKRIDALETAEFEEYIDNGGCDHCYHESSNLRKEVSAIRKEADPIWRERQRIDDSLKSAFGWVHPAGMSMIQAIKGFKKILDGEWEPIEVDW